VSCPSGQTCCGQPAWNSGFHDEAARVARTTLGALEKDGGDAVVVPAGSCATMVKVFWPELFELAGDADAAHRARALGERTYELTAFLAEHPLPLQPLGHRVAYHHSCHMLRELHEHDQPEQLLDAAGCERVAWEADTRCCGFGGLFSFKLPEVSEAMADDKLASLGTVEPPPDLLVGADGVGSVVRDTFHEQFQPSVSVLSNRYIWYGTRRAFEALTLTFREAAAGAFVAHHYRYSPSASTFLIECDVDTWMRAGFATMSEDESRRVCEGIFADMLDGQSLLGNRSHWLTFRVLNNRHWSYRNVVLIGDALRTVHFSIGSGTRMALEDAIALADAVAAHDEDVPASLKAFEAGRRPAVERFLPIATRSADWYEHFRAKLRLAPVPFAYDYVMRAGRISDDRLRARSPAFAAAYAAALAGTG